MMNITIFVRRLLIRLTTGESEPGRRKRLQAETIAAIRARQSFRAADRISRDELHDR